MIKIADMVQMQYGMQDTSFETFIGKYGDAIVTNPMTGQKDRLRNLLQDPRGKQAVYQWYQKWRMKAIQDNRDQASYQAGKITGQRPSKGLLVTLLGDWAEDPRKKKFVAAMAGLLGLGAVGLGIAYGKGAFKDKAIQQATKAITDPRRLLPAPTEHVVDVAMKSLK